MGKSGGTRRTPEQIAAVLADAAMMGQAEAAAKHGVPERTLRHWLSQARGKKAEAGPATTASRQGPVAAKKAEAVSLSERVRETRVFLLRRMMDLAAVSDDLKAVAGAYKLVSDSDLAQQVVTPDGLPGDGAGVAEQGASPSWQGGATIQ